MICICIIIILTAMTPSNELVTTTPRTRVPHLTESNRRRMKFSSFAVLSCFLECFVCSQQLLSHLNNNRAAFLRCSAFPIIQDINNLEPHISVVQPKRRSFTVLANNNVQQTYGWLRKLNMLNFSTCVRDSSCL